METLRFDWSSGDPQDIFEVENPATGRSFVAVQGAGPDEVDRAVKAANAAFHADWRWRSGAERGMLLRKAAQVIRDNADEIARLETRENGKPLAQSQGDVFGAAAILDFYGGLAGKIPGDFHDSGLMFGATVMEPFGVVAGIVPFNWPPFHTAAKIAPAIAVGNTVVIKPPEQTPLSVIRVAELIASVLPADVVQVVPGTGPRAGVALAKHPLVKLISFTGSTRTGEAVVTASAPNTTPTFLELGGKNAMVVFADADLDLAVRTAFDGAFFNQGEACTAISRLVVHESIHDEFVQRLTPLVESLVVGPGTDPTTQVGPMVTTSHRDRVAAAVEQARAEGATVAATAALPADPSSQSGAFVAPALLVGVRPDMAVARQEVFGPVLAVIPFATEEEAIEIANDTDYGLTCAIFSRDQERAFRVARWVDVGMVFINNYFRGAGFGVPTGGTKGSGYGREHSIETLKEYSRWKAISFPSGRGPWPTWPLAASLLNAGQDREKRSTDR